MRIAVDATCWNNRRGYGRHLRSLLAAAARQEPSFEWLLYVDFPPGEERFPFPAGAEVIRVPASVPTTQAAGAHSQRSPGDMWAMARALSAARCDLLLFPTVYSFVPVRNRAPKLLMIHDVIAERFPQYVFPTRGGKLRWRLKTAVARWQADFLVTVSEFSRRALSEHFGIAADRIGVVGEAPDAVFRPIEQPPLPAALAGAGAPAESRIVSYVGGFSPHKNLQSFLQVFLEIAREPDYGDVHLVLSGDYQGDVFHSCYAELRRLAESSPLAARIHFPGFVPDEELALLLNHSALLALPSLMEGYGLPAVEAAACGAPVIVTKQSPLPSLLGEGAWAVDPLQPGELKAALRGLLGDHALRERMGRAALEAARKLTWEQAGRQLIDVCRRAVR